MDQDNTAPDTSGGQDGASATNDGESLDFQKLFESTQKELETTKQKSGQLSKELESVKGESKKTSDVLERMKKSLTGEDDTKSDPVDDRISQLESEIAEYIEAAHEADKAGKPIPLTVKSAVSNLKFQIEALKGGRDKDKTIAELNEKLKKLADPQAQQDQLVYNNFDRFIQDSLEHIYGPGDAYQDQKNVQFSAIQQLVGKELQTLKPEDRQKVWRNSDNQRKLVNYVVKTNMPPAARKLIEQDEIQKTDMTNDELMNAFKEAKQNLKDNPTNKEAKHWVSQTKRELLQRMMDKTMGQASKSRMSELS